MKNKYKIIVLGSGIGGLSLAAELKSKGEEDFIVIDKMESLPNNLHNGLHYLHSSDFGTPFPFEFKKVILTEEIWDTRTNTFKKTATIPEMFEYSKKIMENMRHPASVQDPGKKTEVFVPESNNMNDLLNAYYEYIGEKHFIWNYNLKSIDISNKHINSTDGKSIGFEKCVSTIPINVMFNICHLDGKKLDNPYTFKSKPLYITNYKTTNIVPNWLIGLYMSDPNFPPYRITVLNNILSMESLSKLSYEDEIIIKYIIGDLFDYELSSKVEYCWETGRIFGLEKQERETMVKFFEDNNIYLLGRFSRWDGKLRMDTTIIQGKEIVKTLIRDKGREELIEYLSKN